MLDVVDRLYQAAVDNEHWPQALSAVAQACGGIGATVELHDRPRRSLEFFRGEGMPDAGVERYAAYYHSVCPRLPWGQADPVGTPIYDGRYLTESEMSRSEFYEDFLLPDGFRYMVGGVIANRGNLFGVVAVHRAASAGHADAATIERMRWLLPHFSRALDVQKRLHGARVDELRLCGALDALTLGVVLTTLPGEVQFANSAASRMCSAEGPLALTRSGLIAKHPADARALRRLFPLGGACVLGALGERPLSVVVVPFRYFSKENAWPFEPGGERFGLFIQDVREVPDVGAELLRVAYRLTPAEIELARGLFAGASPREYAARRRVSLNTVRTQLKRLRGKLGVRSQTELVRHLARLIPPVATHTPDG